MTAEAIGAGDSPDLEELFDSIAQAPQADTAPSAAVAPALAEPAAEGAVNDSAELEDLFDSIAQTQRGGAPEGDGTADLAAAAIPEDAAGESSRAAQVINSVGHLTRQLHDTLAELGYDRSIQECAAAVLPDARQRLAYVVTLTEQAASRSLNAVEAATPLQEALAADAASLAEAWDRILAGQGSVDEFKKLAQDTRDYLGGVGQRTDTTREQLREIVMAQEFQDLTGQVLKRITELAHTLETQMLRLLVENAPEPIRSNDVLGLLNGPVVGASNVADVVTDQAQVDELLESLGF
jgi:chemotaxis protein CheZ